MNESKLFRPVWKGGLWFLSILAALSAAAGGFLIFLAFRQTISGWVILCLFGALLFLAPLPFLVYRAYALYHGSYLIEREGLKIKWGLRREDIPLTEIEWVHAADELTTPLRLPPLSMPGACLGESQHPDLGRVEFIASDRSQMVVIETVNQCLVLSPEDPEEFIRTFQRALEMGSILPIEAFSAQPAEFMQNVLAQPLARGLLIAGVLLTLVLAVVTSLLIPLHAAVSMGITANGAALDAVPANRLLILPILDVLVLAIDITAGLYLFRQEHQRIASYLLWAAGAAVPVFLLAALFIMVF